MSTRFPLLVGAGLAAALLATAGCNPPGARTAAASDTSAAAKSYRRAGREGRVLPVLLRRPLRPGLRRRPAVDAPHLDDSRLRAVSGHRLRLRRGVEADDGPVHVGRRAPSRAVAEATASTTAAGCSSTTTPTTASRASTCATSRRSQILGPIPNSSGNHGSSFVTENSEYVLVATRFSVPLPKGRYADPSAYKTEFNGMVSGIKVDPKTGEMASAGRS